ncbi:Tuberculostearic acid methyltransferase UfaA1 [Grifola frondosa]|uniref:Tuberculostearic acid methyltransferase UfaA1 n=1 Tax=Grifola frondosa TaxID=5627 RepID=A0A1C7M9Z3_GRIFR|nr:Tuberculostearic acid methyltransferase UfaA1 [Grifola frondosa]
MNTTTTVACLSSPSNSKTCSTSSSISTLTLHGSSPNRRSLTTSIARSSLISMLERVINNGALEIEESNGTIHIGQQSKCRNVARIRVLSPKFWTRVFVSGDLGFSEAYMIGEVEVDSLRSIMDLWLDNQSSITGLTSMYGRIAAALSGLRNAFFGQTRSRARLNAIASYDQSNELFKAFLSKEMMYSCALWGEEEGGVQGDLISGTTTNDLEVAQLRKIHHVLRRARVKPGDRILEFGSGWGALAIKAALCYGCEVDTLTLSTEQKALAEERIREAGVESRVRVHLLDYRDIPPEFEHAFDAFVSIEMLEHVGSKYYKKYFELVDFALKPRDATIVVTSSTFPEGRYTGYQAEDFMRRYMWPNSCLPSATVLINAAQAGSKGRFTLEGVENHAAHYPRTLRTWDQRLKANISQDAMAKTYPALRDPAEFASFLKKWEYLFAYASAGFAKGYITCHMLTFVRAGDSDLHSLAFLDAFKTRFSVGMITKYAAYHHCVRVNPDIEAGAKAVYEVTTQSFNFEVGAKAYLDSAAFVKAKINNSGVLALALKAPRTTLVRTSPSRDETFFRRFFVYYGRIYKVKFPSHDARVPDDIGYVTNGETKEDERMQRRNS